MKKVLFFIICAVFLLGNLQALGKHPKLIAHRGASSIAPENTLASFQKAVDFEVDWIEFDIHLSKEGVPVIIHDSVITRTTDAKHQLEVHQLTLEEIRSYDAGSWFGEQFKGEKVPTLEEILQVDSRIEKCGLMIELKEGSAPAREIVSTVVSKLRKYAPKNQIIIASFNTKILKEVIKQAPEISILGLIEKLEKVTEFLDMGIRHVGIDEKLLNPILIKHLLKNSVEVWSFTIDNVERAKELVSWEVSGIITNNPMEIQKKNVK